MKRGRGVRREGTEKVASFFFSSYHTSESMVVKNHKKRAFQLIEKVAFHLVMVQVCYFFFKVTHSLKIRMLDSLKLYFTYPESIFFFWNIKPFPSSLGENSINRISLAECLAFPD